MAIEKLYAKRVDLLDAEGNEVKTKSGATKKVTTYHKTFKPEKHSKGETKVGTGEVVECQKSPMAVGDGVYVNADVLTPEELEQVKKGNFKRNGTPRTVRILDGFDSLINTVNSPMTSFSEEQAQMIMSAILNKVQKLENALYKVPAHKAENSIEL